jgi:hypothetical protein
VGSESHLRASLHVRDSFAHSSRFVQHEKTNEARVLRIIDMIIFNNPPDGFSTVCAILHQSSAQCARLAHELEADLRLERGEVRPRQDLLDEAASMVHR